MLRGEALPALTIFNGLTIGLPIAEPGKGSNAASQV